MTRPSSARSTRFNPRVAAIVRGTASEECSVLRSPLGEMPRRLLLSVFRICPAEYIAPCETNAAFCVLDHYPICAMCLNGSATAGDTGTCQGLLNASG